MNAYPNEYSNVRLGFILRRATFPKWKIPPRYIVNYELVLILRGTGKISVEDEEFAVEAGDLLFLPLR